MKLFSSSPDSFTKQKKELKDFFKIDIINLPITDFVEGAQSKNDSGVIIRNFRTTLDYLECGLFDTIEIIMFPNNDYNLIFSVFGTRRINLAKVEELFNSLYLIYGLDDNGKGRFSSEDRDLFYDSDYDILFGRTWAFPKNMPAILFTLNNESDNFSMSIMGIKYIT